MPEILQYVPGTSVFHRLNPLTKILMILVVAVLAVTTSSLSLLTLLVVVLFIAAAVTHLSRPLVQQMPLLISLVISLLLLTVLSMQSGETIGHLVPVAIPLVGGAFPITVGAIEFGLLLSLRFIAMLFAFQLLVITTQPHDLVHALQRLRLPVDYALMFLIALRFIPSLQLEGQRINEAQLARGYNPGTGLRGVVRTLVPIIVPLVSNSLAKANVLGLTIDLRGYRTPRRVSLRDRSLRMRDYSAIALILVASAGFVALPLVHLLN
ncbi:MAG TPA: energy-coupling factor transporter transmembrane component T [Methanoregulaceae archaeon]|nr:energy-coupling factor transporter transmembrane component T [Methanoregulaceae archaeon]HQJ86916.1 energy-coupling factor transporter transmembrane component T [Methanoregulaceae archaeon]